MDAIEWKSRYAERSDLCRYVVHLTKGTEIDGKKYTAIDVLMKILKEGRVKGSSTKSGYINGNRKAVCFQDTPIYSLCQNIYYEQKALNAQKETKIRYRGYGVLFEKPYIFKKGGRPVIYDQVKVAKNYLNPDEWWRIVNFELMNEKAYIDWMHEREWRVPDFLAFELRDVAVIVPNDMAYREFVKRCRRYKEKDILGNVKSIINLSAIFY